MKEVKINFTYSHYDRYIAGFALPLSPLTLETIAVFKTTNFLESREMGFINVGGNGSAVVEGTSYELGFKLPNGLNLTFKQTELDLVILQLIKRFQLEWTDIRSMNFISRTPAARWGEPEDLQGAAIFLSSKASNFVNGHILYVDGGILTTIGKPSNK